MEIIMKRAPEKAQEELLRIIRDEGGLRISSEWVQNVLKEYRIGPMTISDLFFFWVAHGWIEMESDGDIFPITEKGKEELSKLGGKNPNERNQEFDRNSDERIPEAI
jgi:DNA-binding PadR family transcriptional regulator